MLYQSPSSSSLNQFQTSLASPHASLRANPMPEDKDNANLPSFGERFGHFVPQHDSHHSHYQPASPAPVRPSSHHSSLHRYSPSKRRIEDEAHLARDSPARHAEYDSHRTKRRSEAGLWDEPRRESDAYTSPGTSNTSRASTASYPRPALPDISPPGPPTQPFSASFRTQPALPAASPAGPPAQLFPAFSKTQPAHSRPPSWAAENAPPPHASNPMTSAPPPPPSQQQAPPPPQPQQPHARPPPPTLPPPLPQPGPPESSRHHHHHHQHHSHQQHRPSTSADASRRPPYGDSPSSSFLHPRPPPYTESRRTSYPDDSAMPRRPPPLDTRGTDPARPRLCAHCQANPHAPRNVDCPHMHTLPSPGPRSSLPHHPPYGTSYPPANGYPSGHAPPPAGAHISGGDNYSWQPGSGAGIMGDHGNRRRRGNLPKESTAILNNWFNAHANYPYPKEDEKQELQQRCGLSMAQISNWFINARRRRNPQRSSTHVPSPPSKHLHTVAGPPPGAMPPQQALPHAGLPPPPGAQPHLGPPGPARGT